jgi:Plasmid maintenance system antidote protein
MNFGDALRILLEERNITQKRLATDLNIAPSTIGGYVQNSSEPDFETLKRLATYFEVSIDYLLNYRLEKISAYEEADLLRIFRSLSAEQRELYLEQGKAFIRINQKGRVKSS